ncbi:hypothetical protein, partial [Acidiplasma cupricumulans]|uniref:hypothetical protein n=1 Tax=Acidiplasma cupricumulans TaxID=312540 RepID=UPI00191C3C01
MPGPEVYRMSHWNEWEKLDFHIVIAYNDRTNFLINTGMPLNLDLRNNEMMKFAGKRSLFKSYDSIKILEDSGFSKNDIKNISFTPIQDYTTGRLNQFNNAKFFISRRGWIDDIITHNLHNEKRYLFIQDEMLNYILFSAYNRVVFFDSDNITELIPGINALWVGCHHRSSQAFIINTASGNVIFTDASFKNNNINDNLPIGISENIFECYKSYNILKKHGRVLSAYDPNISNIDIN